MRWLWFCADCCRFAAISVDDGPACIDTAAAHEQQQSLLHRVLPLRCERFSACSSPGGDFDRRFRMVCRKLCKLYGRFANRPYHGGIYTTFGKLRFREAISLLHDPAKGEPLEVQKLIAHAAQFSD